MSFDPLEHDTPALDLKTLDDLAQLIAGPPDRHRLSTVAVEVGSWVGRTARVLANHFGRVYCVDTWEGTASDRIGEVADRYGREHVLDTFCHNAGYQLFSTIIPVVGTSAEWARRWPWPVDLVFLDADHTYDAVAADIIAWRPFVRPGGVLCGHDWGSFPGVTRAVAELVPGASVRGSVWWVRT